MACFLGYTGVTSLATPVYQMTLGVSPILLGVALALPRLWEGFVDPLMGNLSDNFVSRWGRRRPFMLVASIAMGVFFGLTWMVSPRWNDTLKLTYFAVMSVFFYAAYALYSIPYSALTYEISPDYHERTRVMAHCSFFHKLGEFGYQWIFPASQMAWFGAGIGGVRGIGWIVGLLGLTVAGAVPALVVRERYVGAPVGRPRIRLWDSLRGTLSCRPFLILAGLVLCNALMGMLTSTLDYYVLVYYVFGGNLLSGSVWKALLSSGYAIVGMATIPLALRLSQRFGKERTLMAIYASTTLGGLLKWVTFNPHHPWLVLFDPVACGFIWVATHMLFASLLADICDEDELQCGSRREGMFGAMYAWIQKSTASASFLGAGIVLTLSGFQQKLGAAQPAHTLTSMRLLLVASTALPPLGAIALLRLYPLNGIRAAETRRRLDERRLGLVEV